MGKHLVLVGGGHAHMVTLNNLEQFKQRGHQVTVIASADYHYYSGMGPGMLGQTYTPQDIRFATRHVVEKKGGTFLKATVSHIDPDRCEIFSQGKAVARYDVLSFNAGSYVPDELVQNGADFIFSSKPIERLLAAQQQLAALSSEKQVTVAVVGGGAAALEIAGNVWRLLSRISTKGFQIQMFTKGRLLDRFPEKVRKAGIQSLEKRGIQLFEQNRVLNVSLNGVALKSGATHAVDIAFLSTGVRPSPIFSASGLATGPQGGLRVNTHLQSVSHDNIFGGGDCIYFQDQPLDKVGVYAVRQNPVLYHNLMAALEGKPLTPFSPGGDYLLIFNMGDGTGIFFKRGILIKGRPAFWIKDYIDRRFMRKFQAAEAD